MIDATDQTGEDMPAEIDFSRGTRGKFLTPAAALHLPVYLDDQVQATLAALADAPFVLAGEACHYHAGTLRAWLLPLRSGLMHHARQ